jgi:uncharacterized MAPEG superfamily protein
MSATIDCRISVRELTIESHALVSRAEARRLGQEVARAVAERLQSLQERRLAAFQNGLELGGAIEIDAVRICLRGHAARHPNAGEIAAVVARAVAKELAI